MSDGGRLDEGLPPAAPPRAFRRAWLMVLGSLVLVGAGAWACVLFLQRSSPTAERRPDVAYVGDASCGNCHSRITESYRRHPMGRSLVPASSDTDAVSDDPAHHNPFEALGSRFLVERRPDGMRHRQTRLDAAGRVVYTFDHEVQYVVGSGTRGRSYLTDREGYLFQSPVSWFSQKQIWDVSPGFRTGYLSGRPVVGECLYCHANRAHFREESVNHYDAPVFSSLAIGCERCHGPAALHVQDPHAGNVVNPGRLAPALRDAVCEQCHLEGEVRVLRRGRGLYDYRPGLPLEQFWSVFVYGDAHGEERRAVNHVEQMHQSRCYLQSSDEDKLGCVSCHDPHVHVGAAERVAYYRDRCLQCHQRQPCSLPAAVRRQQRPDDSCVDCHMPRYGTADIIHTAATDHRVVRRPAPLPDSTGGSAVVRPLVSFHRPGVDPTDRDLARDLGLALVQRMKDGKERPEQVGLHAAALLETALRNDPRDVPAWEARGVCLRLLGRGAAARVALDTAVSLAPERELALVGAALAAQDQGDTPGALAGWRRAVAVNPWMPLYRANRTRLLVQTGAWDEARQECRQWLRLEPESAEARQAWITCLLQEGRKDEARAEFARIEALQPANVRELRAWFEAQLRH
jgi:Flp pilus assembly protein TadD